MEASVVGNPFVAVVGWVGEGRREDQFVVVAVVEGNRSFAVGEVEAGSPLLGAGSQFAEIVGMEESRQSLLGPCGVR